MTPKSKDLSHALPQQRVTAMRDGDMGSLRFCRSGEHRIGTELIAVRAEDEDGVDLEISLNLDEGGELFELDIWKVDFSPLLRLPAPQQVRRA